MDEYFRVPGEQIGPYGDPRPWVMDVIVEQVTMKSAENVEAALAVLPAGYRLCRHGVRITTDPPFDLMSDVYTLRIRETIHTLAPGEQCHVPIEREQYE